jgi:hypothetical protein
MPFIYLYLTIFALLLVLVTFFVGYCRKDLTEEGIANLIFALALWPLILPFVFIYIIFALIYKFGQSCSTITKE